jgi:trimeric autotransporter adhesin
MKFQVCFVIASSLLTAVCSTLAQTATNNSPVVSTQVLSGRSNSEDDTIDFVGNNGTHVVSVTQKGSGSGLSATAVSHAAVAGTITGTSNTAVYGLASNTTTGSNAAGVTGQANSDTGPGVAGYSSSPNGVGVLGVATATTGNGVGVVAITNSPIAPGLYANSTTTTGTSNAIYAQSDAPSGAAIGAGATTTTGNTSGVYASVASPNGAAGIFVNLSGGGNILIGQDASKAVFIVDSNGNGFYAGNLNVTGTVSKGGGSFKIDHPLEPANKYLSHSFVESPDMMNVYNGNIITDRHGLATVTLPDYFEALNRDFRYQLTVIGQFAHAIVAKKITNNQFVIRTNKPSVEVSWQVTGIRQDAYANANRIPVEEDKPSVEQGYYLHPEAFGQPASKSIQAARQKISAAAQLVQANR